MTYSPNWYDFDALSDETLNGWRKNQGKKPEQTEEVDKGQKDAHAHIKDLLPESL